MPNRIAGWGVCGCLFSGVREKHVTTFFHGSIDDLNFKSENHLE